MAFNIIEAQVCGLRNYSFTGTKGEAVQMVNVAFQYNDSRYEGVNVGQVSVTERKAIGDGLRCGSKIKVAFFDKKWHYGEAV